MIWEFSVKGEKVQAGGKSRKKITEHGCNEPFKDRYWCPAMKWFRKDPCPFVSRHECENFTSMCGSV